MDSLDLEYPHQRVTRSLVPQDVIRSVINSVFVVILSAEAQRSSMNTSKLQNNNNKIQLTPFIRNEYILKNNCILDWLNYF